eukprot:TRINITY_DN282_c0_g1_i3.p3 TRINITY_DN282_c0_g1~~TRINITY_DN282_c0_g1_i3.p3  ORF type:complete len:102 (+),score=10.24 TRINITY_DN282_c0_g1_i3:81-386(+)
MCIRDRYQRRVHGIFFFCSSPCYEIKSGKRELAQTRIVFNVLVCTEVKRQNCDDNQSYGFLANRPLYIMMIMPVPAYYEFASSLIAMIKSSHLCDILLQMK